MAKSTKPAVICSHPKLAQGGFSLIEVAITLIVLGLIIVPMIHTYKMWRLEQTRTMDFGNVIAIQNALQKFALRNGRYPLPAEPAIGATNVFFGQETAVPVGTIPACSIVSATVCRTAGQRDVLTPATVPPGNAGNDPVLIGTVPFAALGLPEEFFHDSRMKFFTYAVSEYLTVPATFNDSAGVISLIDDAGAQHTGTSNNLHYAVVSTGENIRGAFSIGGIRNVGCVGAGADLENCDNDSIFNSNFANYADETGALVYQRGAFLVPGPNYYDDYIGFTTSTEADIWAVGAITPDVFSRNNGNVRIGRNPSLTDSRAKIDVMGTPSAPGNIRADRISTQYLCSNEYNSAAHPLYPCAALGVPPTDVGSTVGLLAPAWPIGLFTPAIIGGAPNAANADKKGGGILCSADLALSGIQFANEDCYDYAFPSSSYLTHHASCNTAGNGGRRIVGGVLYCGP